MKSINYTTPPSALILTVDKLSSELFGLDEDELNMMIKDKSQVHKFTESEPKYEDNQPKGTNESTTKFQLQYHDCLDDTLSLTFFDQIIMSVGMTEYLQGNTVVTPNIIYRDLGGAKNCCCFNYLNQIKQSLQKLANLEIRLNATKASKSLFHIKGTAFDEVRYGFVLPAEEITMKLNGQSCQTYKLTGISVVYEYARCKGHTVQIPIRHLSVPHTKNTLEFMLLKIYIYMRILRIQRKLVNSKKKHPFDQQQSILLETLYQTCGFTAHMKSLKVKSLSEFYSSLMKCITRFMDYLIQLKIITSYHLVDNNKLPQKYLKDCTKILITLCQPED